MTIVAFATAIQTFPPRPQYLRATRSDRQSFETQCRAAHLEISWHDHMTKTFMAPRPASDFFTSSLLDRRSRLLCHVSKW